MIAFVEVDLVQAEWVVTAYCAQDVRMLDIVKDERVNPHLRTGSMISGAPEAFVQLEYDLVGKITDPIEIATRRKALPVVFEGIEVDKFFLVRNMSIYQCGKKANHGLNYGEQFKTFALVNGIDEKDAKVIIHNYRDIAYSGLKRYYRWCETICKTNDRRMTNCFGQTRKFMDKWDVMLMNKLYAFIPQSTVGNITNFGLLKIYHHQADPMKRVRPAAQVHDSILNEHEFDSFEELADQVRIVDECMRVPCVYHDEEFIIRREFSIGRDWGEDSMHKVAFENQDDDLVTALQLAWEAGSDQTQARLP